MACTISLVFTPFVAVTTPDLSKSQLLEESPFGKALHPWSLGFPVGIALDCKAAKSQSAHGAFGLFRRQ
jgi:hypothetical protein